jgi:hypothetical protein
MIFGLILDQKLQNEILCRFKDKQCIGLCFRQLSHDLDRGSAVAEFHHLGFRYS